MNPLLALILPSLIPIIGDGLRSVFNLIAGRDGAQPQTVDEEIKLMQAEVAKLQALAQLDSASANISLWVANLRASFRYIAAGIIIIPAPFAVAYAMINPDAATVDFVNVYLSQLVAPVFSFLFGARLWMQIKNNK